MTDATLKPTQFRDTQGRVYDLKITCAASMKLEEPPFNLNLRDHLLGDGILYAKMAATTSMLFNVVGVLAAKSLDEHGIGPQELADAIDGDSLEAMRLALQEAIVDFSPPGDRPATRRIHERLQRACELSAQKVETQAETMLSDDVMTEMLNKQMEAAQRDFNEKRQAALASVSSSSPSPE